MVYPALFHTRVSDADVLVGSKKFGFLPSGTFCGHHVHFRLAQFSISQQKSDKPDLKFYDTDASVKFFPAKCKRIILLIQ